MMDAIELLRDEIKSAWAWLEFTVHDVTQEQAIWQPPGTANSIGVAYAHLIISADAGFNSQFDGHLPVIARDFGGKVGLSEMNTLFGDMHEWGRRVRIDWDALHAYGRAVQHCVEEYAERLSAADLDRPVDMTAWGLGMWNGLAVYKLHGFGHVKIHGGEIACLKGLQGGRGWPNWRSGDGVNLLARYPGTTPDQAIVKEFAASR
jgi:hypothetical protein